MNYRPDAGVMGKVEVAYDVRRTSEGRSTGAFTIHVYDCVGEECFDRVVGRSEASYQHPLMSWKVTYAAVTVALRLTAQLTSAVGLAGRVVGCGIAR